MTKARKSSGRRLCFSIVLAVAALAALAAGAQAEDGAAAAADRKPQQTVRQLSGDYPSRPSLAPSWSIPCEPLGFAAPGALYLGERNALVSLNFLGEDRLLFTFRVPGLLHREPGGNEQTEERYIRALVLALPSGSVQAETTWIVHDRARYLWALDNGHFLVRDSNSLLEGDATLKLKPFLRFPGPLLMVDLDPGQNYLVTNSREPVPTDKSAAEPGSATAAQASGDDEPRPGDQAGEPDLVARVMRRDSGGVLLVDRVREMVRLPLNSDGYLDILRGDRNEWAVQMNYFTGGQRIVGSVLSACTPDLNFLSETEVLANACSDMGDDALVALNTDGEKLWTDLVPDRQVWPLVLVAPAGLRFVRESLYVTHSISALAPLGDEDVRGQWVQVFNDATGQTAFESPASPVFDGGGNVAISPSGRRVAVINNGAIQVFELPTAPQLPQPMAGHAGF